VGKLPRIDYAALVECVRAETYRDPIGEGLERTAAAAWNDVVVRYWRTHPKASVLQVRRALQTAVRRGLVVGDPANGYMVAPESTPPAKPKPATKCPRFTPEQRRALSLLSDGYARTCHGEGYNWSDLLCLRRRGFVRLHCIPAVEWRYPKPRSTYLWQITPKGLEAWRAYQATGWADTPRSPKTPHHKETNR